MRYLRMLLNSVVAGGVAAGYVLILFLQLNPQLSRAPGAMAPLAVALLGSYGLHFAVVFYGLTVLRQVFGAESLSPGWISVRVLVWECATAAAIGAGLMWLNLAGLRLALDAGAAHRMALGASALTVCAGLMVALAGLRSSVGPRWRVGAAAFAVVLIASLVVPLWMRGPGRVPAPVVHQPDAIPSFAGTSASARVVMLVVDGASLDFISQAAADGRLPNFGRLLDSGAALHLATLRPTQPDPVWTSVATGKLPVHHGVRSSGLYTARQGGATFDLLPDYCFAHALVYFGFLSEVPQTSASVRAWPVWQLLGASGIGSAVVRWPLTWPVRPMRGGVLVSERLHLAPEAALDLTDSPATYPSDLLATLRARPDRRDVAEAALSLYGSVREPREGAGALALDRFYAGVFEDVRDEPGVRLAVLRYQGLDVAGHYYLRQAMPRAFGEVSGEDRRATGRVLDQYYRFLDGEVGRSIDRLGQDDLLLVVSAFGMEPLSLPKRLIDRTFGRGSLSGTHERAPDGFLIAFGRAVQAGRLPRSSVLDVTPTLLYFFGLPIGRDMDGYARTDVFTRAFTDERPVAYIPTYERD